MCFLDTGSSLFAKVENDADFLPYIGVISFFPLISDEYRECGFSAGDLSRQSGSEPWKRVSGTAGKKDCGNGAGRAHSYNGEGGVRQTRTRTTVA